MFPNDVRPADDAMIKTHALQTAIINSTCFSSIATDARGVIQIFNVGAERMLGYAAADVIDKRTPADMSDPQELIARAEALGVEFGTQITPGFEALSFKASRGIEDIYELTYIRKNGTRFPAVVSVTALRDEAGAVIGYLLIGRDDTARRLAEEAIATAKAMPPIDYARRLTTLTPREREVHNRMIMGLTSKVIAVELGGSFRTIEIHRTRVMSKMAAGNLADLVRMRFEAQAA